MTQDITTRVPTYAVAATIPVILAPEAHQLHVLRAILRHGIDTCQDRAAYVLQGIMMFPTLMSVQHVHTLAIPAQVLRIVRV